MLSAVTGICVTVHLLFRKELVFVSFDRETAEAVGLQAPLWNGLLFFTIGLAIPVAARALGALPVFAFLTIPAAAALLVRARAARRLRARDGDRARLRDRWLSRLLVLAFPTGATMVALAGLFVLPGALLRGR